MRLVYQLTVDGGIDPKSIAILSPYNAQVAEISKSLQSKGIHGVTVCTIMKSQGEAGRTGDGWLSCLLPSRGLKLHLAERVFEQIPHQGGSSHGGGIPGPGFWLVCCCNESFGNLWMPRQGEAAGEKQVEEVWRGC